MKITTLWQTDKGDPDQIPWVICAYDEYTADEHGGEPDFYTKEKNKYPDARELVIDIPEIEVRNLFRAPTVKGKVEKSAPVCKTCNDTHTMMLDERQVMCTRCPTPCQKCRQGGMGPYCENTPCSCECHRG